MGVTLPAWPQGNCSQVCASCGHSIEPESVNSFSWMLLAHSRVDRLAHLSWLSRDSWGLFRVPRQEQPPPASGAWLSTVPHSLKAVSGHKGWSRMSAWFEPPLRHQASLADGPWGLPHSELPPQVEMAGHASSSGAEAKSVLALLSACNSSFFKSHVRASNPALAFALSLHCFLCLRLGISTLASAISRSSVWWLWELSARGSPTAPPSSVASASQVSFLGSRLCHPLPL